MRGGLGLGLEFLGALFGHALGIGTHLGLEQLFGAADPGTLAKDTLYILGEDDLAVDEQLSQLGVTLLVLGEDLLGTLVLLIDHAQHLVVHDLGRRLGVRLLELVFGIVVIADVGQLIAHAGEGNHAVGLLGGALQVVHGTCGDAADEELFGGAASEEGAHLVEHGLLGLEHTLFGQIPGSTEGLTARYDRDLDQRVGKFGEPRDGGVTGLVDGDGALFGLGHHLGLLLQTADDTVDGIEEVLLLNRLRVVAGSDEGSLVADIGDIGTREAWRLTGEEVDVDAVVGLDGLEVYLEDFLTLVEVGEVYMYLTIKTASTEQG